MNLHNTYQTQKNKSYTNVRHSIRKLKIGILGILLKYNIGTPNYTIIELKN